MDAYEEHCRACMRNMNTEDVEPKHDLFYDSELAMLYDELCGCEDGELPKYLCGPCARKVRDFHEFREMCLESVEEFRMRREFLKGNIAVHAADEDFESMASITVDPPTADETIPVQAINNMLVEEVDEENINSSEHIDRIEIEPIQPENPLNEPQTEGSDSEAIEEYEELDSIDEETAENVEGENLSAGENDGVSKNAVDPVKRLKCSLCPKVFNAKHQYDGHMRTHEGLKPFACDQPGCKRNFNSWTGLKRHTVRHSDNPNWVKCEEPGCDRTYKSKNALYKHMRNFHQQGPPRKTYVCEICGKVLKTSTNLNVHRFAHKDKSERPLACPKPHCTRRFLFQSGLDVHLQRHAGINNYICPYCGEGKPTRNEINNHINFHTKERQYPCRKCSQIFYSAHARCMHEQSAHWTSYTCRFCGCAYRSQNTRRVHEMTHTGRKPYKCKECGRCFTQSSHLRTHLNKIHMIPKEATLLRRRRLALQTPVASAAEEVPEEDLASS